MDPLPLVLLAGTLSVLAMLLPLWWEVEALVCLIYAGEMVTK